MMELRWQWSTADANEEAEWHYFCVLDLQPSWGQDEGDEGGGEQHLEDGNVASISGFEAFGKGIGGEDTKASRGPCEMRLEQGPG